MEQNARETIKIEELKLPASSIIDSYEGFALGLSVIAKAEGFADKVVFFMKENCMARSNEIIDFLDMLIEAKEGKVETT